MKNTIIEIIGTVLAIAVLSSFIYMLTASTNSEKNEKICINGLTYIKLDGNYVKILKR